MFLVGIDIVGDKILEVNVFSPGNLKSCSTLAGVEFSEAIIDLSNARSKSARNMARSSTIAILRCSEFNPRDGHA